MLGFRSDSAAGGKIERAIAELTLRRQTLAARLSGAERAVEQAAAKRVDLLTQGDVDDRQLGDASGQVACANENASGFKAALAAVDAKLRDATEALAAEREQVSRTRFSDWADAKLGAISGASTAFQEASNALATALQSASQAGAQIAAMVMQSASGLTVEVAAVVRGLEQARAGVLDGSRPVPDAKAPTPSSPDVPDIPRVAIYALRALRWVEPNGETKVVAKYGIAQIPRALGEVAISRNLADSSTSTRALELMKALAKRYGRHRPARRSILINSRPKRRRSHDGVLASQRRPRAALSENCSFGAHS
jgi:hypothetical protein